MKKIDTGYVTTLPGIPFVSIPRINTDEILVFFFDMQKYDIGQVQRMFDDIKREFPERTCLALPHECDLQEFDDTQLEWMVQTIRGAMKYQSCDWCDPLRARSQEGGAEDLVYSVETAVRGDIDQESGMLSVYDRGQLVARRHVNFCPMCGRPVGRFAPTKKQEEISDD